MSVFYNSLISACVYLCIHKKQVMNTRIFAFALLATLLATASCGSNDTTDQAPAPETPHEPRITVSAMSWLQGRWESRMPEGTAFEEWSAGDGQQLSGRGGFIKGADTTVSETVIIRMQDTNLLYIPTVKGQNNDQPVPFTLTIAAGDSFVFENAAHDFPQAICYKKLGDTAMEARISGKIEGKDASEAFVLNKVR